VNLEIRGFLGYQMDVISLYSLGLEVNETSGTSRSTSTGQGSRRLAGLFKLEAV
jgi:hypothetical protein